MCVKWLWVVVVLEVVVCACVCVCGVVHVCEGGWVLVWQGNR